jgi:diguanylate cyclase (GGDEF)-like protein/PAS domain S-box-containing protein
MRDRDKIYILLVDDRPENLLALEAIIEREEYKLVKANSGEEALKFLLKYDFAAILLDVQMPGIDGFETAKIIKAREKTKNIPILFITANHLDSQHIFIGYSIGAIDYILKPFDPIVLKAKVDGFVELYKLNQQLVKQAAMLSENKNELETAYKELSHLAAELRISEGLANVISETSMDTMVIMDETGTILKVNPAVEQMFKYHASEIIGENILMLFSSCDTSTSYIKKILGTVNGVETFIFYGNSENVIATRRNGDTFPVEIQIGKRIVQDRTIIAITIRDLTKQKQYDEIITHMAYHDSLTDLPNRRLFNEQLIKMLEEAKYTNQLLALLFIDMDRFKFINDSLGHVVGDRVLQEIAKKLNECVDGDSLLARIGGDEFNMILPSANREKALEVAERIVEKFKKPLYVDHYELFITISIGISIFPFDGEDTISLIKNADVALYRAKEQGKNSYKVYHSGMNIQSYKNFILQNDLRKAIERDELFIVYQPRIDIETGLITSAEALLRWNHPSLGTISPMEFIPLAEETGQIVEIGEWVLKTVCQQLKGWEAQGLVPLRVAVNFSAQQFLQKDLIPTINRMMNEWQVTGNMLEIEITESVILANESIVTNTLNQLKNLGIILSIDDFGTGYSSLNYLRRYPVHTIKIDQTFISDLTNPSSDSKALVSTIISLAKHLNMHVIAEGVETAEQLAQLRQLDCQEYQGFLFSPPVLPHQYEQFLLKINQDKPILPNTKLLHSKDEMTRAVPPQIIQSDVVTREDILNLALNRMREIYFISVREMDVFKLMVNGLSNKEISEQLFISEHTVKNHITRIFQKLTVNDRLQAIAKVYQECIEEGKNLSVH